MSFAAACDWSLGRSLFLALIAAPACWWLERGLRASRQRLVYLGLLVSPFLFPELLIGYLLAPQVVGRPWRAELACALVLLLRSVPIGVVALWCTPASDVTPAALFLRRLKLQSLRDAWELLRCYGRGPVRRMLPSCGLMFLITFQEFEAAALLGATSWTDQLFTEYATGLSLGESSRFLIRPVVIQAVLLALVGWGLWDRSGDVSHLDSDGERPVNLMTQRMAEMASVGFFLLGVVGPLALLARELTGGWSWLWNQPTAGKSLATEICTAGLVALVAGVAAWTLVSGWNMSLLPRLGGEGGRRPDEGVVTDQYQSHAPPLPNPLPRGGGEGTMPIKWGRWLTVFASLPGLCGGLTVSLIVLWISSRLFPFWLSGTPLAWVVALVVWLLPRSVLLQFWLRRQSDPAAMHLVALLRESPQPQQRMASNRWWWRWRIEPQFVAVGLLCYWAYLDLTAAALLAPPGMASVLVRLYNFMHFGHSAAMSMEAAIVMFLPVILWGLMMAAARMAWERRV